MSPRPRVHVVGLGPGDPGLVTVATRDLIDTVPVRFVRTRRHPSVALLGEVVDFDHHYDTADSIDAVYASIAADVAAAALEHGEVLYAVPGSPVVAETTVELLLADERLGVLLHPAMSFLDLTWARLGIDPVEERAVLVDGHRVEAEVAGSAGPFLIAQCDHQLVLGDVKLAFDDHLDHRVTVLQRLGLPDEAIVTMRLAEIDREVTPDHLTSLWVPALPEPAAAAFVRLEDLMRRLRARDPWKASQTHESLKRYLLEETYEVLEAIDAYDPDSGEGVEELCSELGDLLYQVVFHSAIAAEDGWFALADVVGDLHDKLVRRHPHLDGPDTPEMATLVGEWEAGKVVEHGRSSPMDGIPSTMPALARAAKVAKRAEALRGPAEAAAAAVGLDQQTLGAALLDLVDLAHRAGLDPEDALRVATDRRIAELRDAAGDGS